MDNRQSHHTHELHRHLLESSADASAFLQPADGLSDDAPSSSGPLVEHRAAIVTQQLLVVTRDKRCNAVSAQPVTDTMITIALVTREHRRPLVWWSEGLRNRDLVHHGLDAGRDVHLSVGDFNFQRQASTVSNQVKLAAESASRQAQSMVLRLIRVPMAAFFPAPAAARADRTDAPEIPINLAVGIKSDVEGFSSIRSYTPAFLHRAKWSYTACHGPNRSGMFRQFGESTKCR